MITPEEIRKKTIQKYLPYLSDIAADTPFAPIEIRGDKTYAKNNFSDFAQQIESLNSQAKDRKGFGYTVDYKRTRTKYLGEQDIPVSIYFETEQDFLRFLSKEKEVAKFRENIALIISIFPQLTPWIQKYPKKVVQNETEWTDILKVCSYFKENPHPNCYIRELPIAVHTKFVEQHKGILQELLNILLADTLEVGATHFEQRFHLKDKEPLVRFRILDQDIADAYFQGIDDMAIPISLFNRLALPVERVWVVENKTSLYTTLAFPAMEKSIAIFGSGYGVAALKEASWLATKKLYYWGDIDAQGFEILSQFRTYFPSVESFLMDEATFEHFYEAYEGTPSSITVELRLTPEEKALYERVKTENLRLEQEKIPQDWLLQTLVLITTYL